jgi:hypothetical protein
MDNADCDLIGLAAWDMLFQEPCIPAGRQNRWFTESLNWGRAMFAGRSAILLLALSLTLLASPVSGSSGGRAGNDGVSTSTAVDLPTAGSVSLGLPDSAAFARFKPWKARLKIVLEVKDHNFVEEVDHGLFRRPHKLVSRASAESATSRPSSAPPLRC